MEDKPFNILLHNLSEDEYNFTTQELQKTQKIVILNNKFIEEGLDITDAREVVIDAISKYIKTNETCVKKNITFVSGVNSDYVLDSLEQSNAIIFFSENQDDIYSSIIGFATMNFEKNMKRLHIDVICAKTPRLEKNEKKTSLGKILMDKIKEIARYLHMDEICLLSIEGAFKYYVDNGFKCKGEDGLTEMVFSVSKPVSKPVSKSVSKPKKTIKMRSILLEKQLFPKKGGKNTKKKR